jgi:VWFA-related protein
MPRDPSRRSIVWLPLLLLAAGAGVPPLAQEAPLETDVVEESRVRLVLLDVVVLDGQNRTVPGLGIEDFEVVSDGTVAPPDTLDVACSEVALPDATGASHARRRETPAAPEAGRRIVIAVDYLHLAQVARARVIDAAMEAVQHGTADGDELMVAALNGGLRIEQPFTRDRDAVVASLHRMKFDISLWQPDYTHLTDFGFTSGMIALFEVLAAVPGPKAVVMYSAMGDVPLEKQFEEIAAVAASARCSIYPVDPRGLTIPGAAGSRGGSGAG